MSEWSEQVHADMACVAEGVDGIVRAYAEVFAELGEAARRTGHAITESPAWPRLPGKS